MLFLQNLSIGLVFFLPKDTYEECSKLYSFCRVLDDVADANQDLEIKKERFNELKEIFLGGQREVWLLGDFFNWNEIFKFPSAVKLYWSYAEKNYLCR